MLELCALIYVIAGAVFEGFVLYSYAKSGTDFKIIEYVIGGIQDIIFWPIILAMNIIMWRRK